MPIGRWLLFLLYGVLIGGGAVLPGISGGVLCVVFGIYRPMMEVLAHPKTGLPKYFRMFIPVGIGWALGFLLFAKVIEVVFQASELLATWLFIGLIAGTIPSLLGEAGKNGRSRGCWISGGIAFLLLFGTLLTVRLSSMPHVTPNAGWYLFSGVLWGLSLIIPGLTSSSILISLGLLEPLLAAVTSFDLTVFLLWGVGLVGTVVALAKFVNHLFEKYYALAYHAVVGIVVASTLIIVPTTYESVGSLLISILCAVAGFVTAYFLGKLDAHGSVDAETEAQEKAEQ